MALGGARNLYYLGIDLGTTYTAAAVWRDGRAEVASLGVRAHMVPSVVLLREDGQLLYGEAAERRAASEPHRVAREFKRRIGDPTPLILDKAPFAADMLMAKLLRWVVDTVSETEGGPPTALAVSHPANWGDYKRDLLRQALRVTGFEAAVMVTEPEAAAIHYATQERVERGSVVAVYDLGGGTFDAAVLKRVEAGWEILGRPEGIERLGGIDFDQAVFGHVVEAAGITADLEDDDPDLRAAVHRLRRDCVASKEALSADTETSLEVLFPELQSQVRLTRTEFEDMIRPTLQDTIAALNNTLRSAEVTAQDVQAVLLVGGSSRVPLVAQVISSELGRPVALDAHPKHGVALGAAIVAAEDNGQHELQDQATGPDAPHEPVPASPAAPRAATIGSPPPTAHVDPYTYPGGRRQPGRAAVLATIAALGALAAVAALTLRSPGSDDDADAALSPGATTTETTASTTTETTARPTTTGPPATSTTALPTGEPQLNAVPIPPSGMDPNEASHEIVRGGTGQNPAGSGDTITFQFIGRIDDGTEFVNSWRTSGAVTFTLGSGELLSGFDEALQGVAPGDRAEVYVGSEAAYGASGNRDGTVPPDSNLAYLVDVISVNGMTAN